ncbi:MAG: type II toxin-antitoxin system death-on-curing family toxin [Clostridium sp.]|nr:type II toxin-antitoxin system death-on-curing family toxin [Clostridium sp.]
MIKLSKEQIKNLHKKLIEATGGLDGIRDEWLLDSAISAPFQSFGGEELYPSVKDKAARLCFGLIKNHIFIDGNKRIGIYVMLVFLQLNGIFINCGDKEIVELGIGIAEGKFDDKYIINWIENHEE